MVEAEARTKKPAGQLAGVQRSDAGNEPRTIIHFANSTDALKGILSVGFKIKYPRIKSILGTCVRPRGAVR